MGHKLITLIVYAEDEDDAVSRATYILEDMCSGRRIYNWYSLFTEESKNTTAGIGRWGKLPLVTPANSKIGKKLIDEGLDYTKKEIKESLSKLHEKIRDIKDEDIEKLIYKVLNEDDISYLYDNNGEAIINEERLNKVLNKLDDSKYKDLKVYVVPADIHS